MTERLSGSNNNSTLETAESKLSRLIDSGDSVNGDFLKRALANKEITKNQYVALADKLLEKSEWVEEGLVSAGKKLGAQVEELEIDPVTKLFKHNLLERKLGDLIKELNFESTLGQRRQSRLHAVMVIATDLDDLKRWNTYGHSIGDKALQTIADSLKETTRNNDYIFRLGDKSDEIVMTVRIEKDLKPDELEKIFKNIQNAINSRYIKIDDVKLPVTAAAGCVILKPGESRNVEQILHAADLNQTADKALEIKRQRIEKAIASLNSKPN